MKVYKIINDVIKSVKYKLRSLDYFKMYKRILAIATKVKKIQIKSQYMSTLNGYMIFVGRQDNQTYLYSSLDLKSFEPNVLCLLQMMCANIFLKDQAFKYDRMRLELQ